MNPINRIGQKVICVVPDRFWTQQVCPSLKVTPRKGEVYTVTGFEDLNGVPCIHLREIAGLSCECGGINNAPWLIAAFRPVNERKTDISVFTEIMHKTNAPERIKA
jgi:hypothetical protein